MHTIPSKRVVLVDFWAPWCGPCKAMIPILDKLQQNIKQDFEIKKVNIDEVEEGSIEHQLLLENDVRAIPHIALYKNNVLIEKLVGVQTLTTLETKINEQINS